MAERYSRSATAGDDRAQFYLGALYSAGVGLRQSDEQAFNWISRAAQQGHSQAMLVLGGMLTIGRGAQKDNVAAYKWAYIVAEGSRIVDLKNGARQLVALLETRLTPAEIARAKSDAERFRATSPQFSIAPTNPPNNNTDSNNAPSIKTRSAPETASQPPLRYDPPGSSPASAIAPPPNQPESRSANERTPPNSKYNRDVDIDQYLDKVPSNIRKRLGF